MGTSSDDQLFSRPPRKGDKLFRAGLSDWPNNAWLPATRGDSLPYTEGYRRGADRLVQHIIESQRDQDFLVYPVIFLYRHHIELILKSMVIRSVYLIGQAITDKEKKNLQCHRLDLLWEDLKPRLDAIAEIAGWKKLDQAEIEGVDDYIQQLFRVDPDSFSFRYATSKKGNPSLPEDLTLINLRHLAEMIGRLADYLDGINTGIEAFAEGKAEIETEWRNEMASCLEWA